MRSTFWSIQNPFSKKIWQLCITQSYPIPHCQRLNTTYRYYRASPPARPPAPDGPPGRALLIQETAMLAPVTVEGAAGQVMHY